MNVKTALKRQFLRTQNSQNSAAKSSNLHTLDILSDVPYLQNWVFKMSLLLLRIPNEKVAWTGTLLDLMDLQRNQTLVVGNSLLISSKVFVSQALL